jgi:methylated-DNA-[protein]-cysteine S-methyltransferase
MNHPALIAQMRIETPLGPLTLAASARGLAGAWFDLQRHHPGAFDGVPVDPRQRHLAQAAREFDAYFGGAVRTFAVALDAAGTPFQHAVWRALLEIAAGATSTYRTVAGRIGAPQAVRAVGAAVGRNPLGIIVPCHRVLGSDGSLTGYAGGLHRKQALLEHERAFAGGAGTQMKLLAA